MSPSPRPGRPRSEQSRRAVLESAAALITESGYEQLTIEAIAARAGVSRQTIYRWWRNKASIVAEAVVGGVVGGFDASALPSGLGLSELVQTIIRDMSKPESASLVRGLAAAAAGDVTDADALYEHSTRASHAAIANAVRAEIEAGAAPGHLDPSTAADQIIGAVVYRIMTRQPIPEGFGQELLNNLIGPVKNHNLN